MSTQYISTKVLLLVTTTFLSSAVFAMGKQPVKDPAPAPSPSPSPKPSPAPTPLPTPAPREPAAVTDPITPANFDVFGEVSYPVGQVVDTRFSSYRELLPVRNAQDSYRTDNCDVNLDSKDRFSDRVAYAVELKMQPSKAQVGYVYSYFGLNKDVNAYMSNSFISHPLCEVTSSSLNTTLKGKNVPSSTVIKKINQFSTAMNGYRREALAGNREGYVKASKLWSKFMMCLSYTESLTSADSSKSQSVSQKYAPSGYRKPAGVKFYEDPYQDEASKLNIGMFQFTPNSGGNIQACIREWNVLYPTCSISQTATKSELIRALGSSLQTFNAFCGAAKVTGMFGVQVNTTKSAHTHPANVKSNGALKAPAERCVSPHMSGNSYNHFGPFQNSTGKNLEEVMNCVLAGEY